MSGGFIGLLRRVDRPGHPRRRRAGQRQCSCPRCWAKAKTYRAKLVEHDGFNMFGFRDGVRAKWIQPELRQRQVYSPTGSLYDLAHDLGETNNLQSSQLNTSKKMASELEEERRSGGKPKTVGRDSVEP